MKYKNKAIRIISAMITVLLLLFSLAGCGQAGKKADKVPKISEEASDELAASTDPVLIEANSRFAFKMFNQLVKEDKDQNVFISPLSILLALAMTYNGAMGQTSSDMADALEFSGMDIGELNQGFNDLMLSILNADKEVKISIANSIWQNEGFSATEGFIDTNKEYYNSQVRSLDFSRADAVDIINGWIADATEDLIQDMLDRIPPDAVMYLINAIYFKGDWTYPFDEGSTTSQEFYLDNDNTKEVQMMHLREYFDFGVSEDFSGVELPYGDGGFSMYMILPDEGIEIDEMIEGMDERTWKDFIDSLTEKDIDLYMPRFKMEYGVKMLNDSLSYLGMEIAFGPAADFSKIDPDVFISRVLHQAVIEVNEKGTEAAAATIVEMVESAMPVEEFITFRVDRPFFFIIADSRNDSIVFMGKVVEP